MFDVKARLEHLLSQLETEIDILQVEKRIRGRVKRQMEKSQREYYLNEQVKAIQKELGEGEEGADLEEMEKTHPHGAHAQGRAQEGRSRAEEAQADVADVGGSHGGAQLHRDAGQPAVAQEVEDLASDIKAAQEILDKDHYGLEKVKERIVEYLAVQTRVDKMKAPILCLVGAPGVGKTSLGQSIAQGDQPQVRAHVARRRARRGRDPRPSPHLHRLDAGQDPAEHDARSA